MKLLTSMIFAGLLSVAPSFAWAESSLFSGFELFPGLRLDGVTIGATFSGWTDAPAELSWVPFRETTGGFVSGSINYSGQPGFGHSVSIFGGNWSWLEADDHTIHSGPVKSGAVLWPTSAASTNLDSPTARFGVVCGPGVAHFTASVRDASSNTIGTIDGCLNDQLTFPPKIWGDVDLPSAP
jgi:hypothetical protein